MNLDAFDPAGRADLLAFMRGRLNPRASGPPPAGAPPANRGPAGRFAGAAQGGGGGFRAAGVAPRPPPRDVKDMSCVNCGKKGHMARDCRQPRQEDKAKRPCFVCGKIGHLARDCREKPLKMIETGESRQLVFLGCVEAVDADGFCRVGRPQPRCAHILDFISRAAAPVIGKTPDSNRFQGADGGRLGYKRNTHNQFRRRRRKLKILTILNKLCVVKRVKMRVRRIGSCRQFCKVSTVTGVLKVVCIKR